MQDTCGLTLTIKKTKKKYVINIIIGIYYLAPPEISFVSLMR